MATRLQVPFGPDWSASLARAPAAALEDWLAAALEWADEADALALSAFGSDLQPSRKPDRTFVTEVDRAIEARLRSQIARRYPDHDLMGEEYGPAGDGGRYRWIVDPIDGTHNFIRGIPLFATLIALECEGELQLGVVSAPALGARWFARRGGGAWVQPTGSAGRTTAPRRLSVSAIDRLDEAQVLFGSLTAIEAAGYGEPFRRLLHRVWRERGFGDFWGYALLAQGAAEAVVEAGLSPWDVAAVAVLVEEAGGAVTNAAGRRELDGRTVVATNGRLHRVVLDLLASPNEEAQGGP
jgi:histidinol-phosphatase